MTFQLAQDDLVREFEFFAPPVGRTGSSRPEPDIVGSGLPE